MTNHNEQPTEILVKRPDLSVVNLVLDRNTGRIDTNNYNITKREVLEMFQQLVIKLTQEMLREALATTPNTEDGT